MGLTMMRQACDQEGGDSPGPTGIQIVEPEWRLRGLPIPEQRGQKRVMPYTLMSVLEDQGMAVSALPNFFISRLFVVIELLSRV